MAARKIQFIYDVRNATTDLLTALGKSNALITEFDSANLQGRLQAADFTADMEITKPDLVQAVAALRAVQDLIHTSPNPPTNGTYEANLNRVRN